MATAQKNVDAEIKKIRKQSEKLASSMPTGSNIPNTPGVGEGCMSLAPYTPAGNINNGRFCSNMTSYRERRVWPFIYTNH